MTAQEHTVWLLGPQYHEPTLGTLFPTFGIPGGPVAVVTAGWQEREGEDQELDKQLGRRSVDLRLYQRADRVFRADAELTEAHREMQRQLREVERLYDLRLSFLRETVLRLFAEESDAFLLEPERDHAMEQVRELDAWHLKRIVELRGEFERSFQPLERESVAREREEIRGILGEVSALVIAGGHVAIVLNRLRLFGVSELAGRLPFVAWSAGAMALTERVVLFHDHPPQGPGNAEVMEQGLGLCPRIVALPDGKKRLDLEDRHRVASFAQRFAPDACVVLSEGDCLRWDGGSWTAREGALRLGEDGETHRVSSW